jgi:hypothetical protein
MLSGQAFSAHQAAGLRKYGSNWQLLQLRHLYFLEDEGK